MEILIVVQVLLKMNVFFVMMIIIEYLKVGNADVRMDILRIVN